MLQKLQDLCNSVQVKMLVPKLLFMPREMFVDTDTEAALVKIETTILPFYQLFQKHNSKQLIQYLSVGLTTN